MTRYDTNEMNKKKIITKEILGFELSPSLLRFRGLLMSQLSWINLLTGKYQIVLRTNKNIQNEVFNDKGTLVERFFDTIKLFFIEVLN